jgi:hypothetical protein
MPVLQWHIPSFVRTWNSHAIRKQNNRPHVVHGKPFMNYYYPGTGVQNAGSEVNNDTLGMLWNDVKDWGKYLFALRFVLLF